MRIFWGDEHVQQSSIVNITHVDPTLSKWGVRVDFRVLVVLVCLASLGGGAIVGFIAAWR